MINRLIEQLKQRDQRWVDEVCYYRNLAIMCGAKAADMLNATDRALCERGLTGSIDGEISPAYERAEIAELWEDNSRLVLELDAALVQVDRLTAENKRLRTEVARAALEIAKARTV